MIKKTALLLILLIKLIESTKYSDFCYRTSIKNKIKECQDPLQMMDGIGTPQCWKRPILQMLPTHILFE